MNAAKLSFTRVSIITTTKCNMKCKHCMRYDTEEEQDECSERMNTDTIDRFLLNVDKIIGLTFSGGDKRQQSMSNVAL